MIMEDIELTKENTEEWKAILEEKAIPYFGKGFSELLCDEELLSCHEGDTVNTCLCEQYSYGF